MSTQIVQEFVVAVHAPRVALYDVWSHRTGREPLQVNNAPATLAAAKSLIALLRSDPHAAPQEFEIVPAGERAATMPELLERLHELEDYCADLESRIEQAMELLP